MTKIKYINCFGTSYTAGGGFEFKSTDPIRNEILKETYSPLGQKMTQYNFSYPGRLQSLVRKEGVEVRNFGKQGYGNERLYRKAYDVINRHDFNPNEHIFLFEFSDLGRREFWSNEFNSYLILNYLVDLDTGKLIQNNGLAKSWYYDSWQEKERLNKLGKYFYKFLKKTFNLKETVEIMDRNSLFFLSFLNERKINYYFVNGPNSFKFDEDKRDKFINFGDGNFLQNDSSFIYFCEINKLFITDETPEGYNDAHNGFVGNTIVAKVIYNFLIDQNYFDLPKLKIDWEYYSKVSAAECVKNNKII
jgi:hypothetical protein